MVKKAKLAQFIRAGYHTPQEWYQFMPKIKGLRVKEVGSKGEVLISLDDSGSYDPRGWLENYKASVREQLDRELKIAEAALAPQELEGIILQHVASRASSGVKLDQQTLLRIAADPSKTGAMRLQMCLSHVLNCNGYSVLNSGINELIQTNPYVKK